MYQDIQARLVRLVEQRHFYFKETLREDAARFLESKTSFRGLPEEEIFQIESNLQKTLPDDFVEYLKMFGKNCGELFCNGNDLEVQNLVKYQEWGLELLEECGITDFINASTVFFEFHQGYACSCFHAKEEGPLCVFQFQEGNEQPVKRFENFSAMLESEVHNLELGHAQQKDSEGHFVIIKDGFIRYEFPAKNSDIIPREVGDLFLD